MYVHREDGHVVWITTLTFKNLQIKVAYSIFACSPKTLQRHNESSLGLKTLTFQTHISEFCILFENEVVSLIQSFLTHFISRFALKNMLRACDSVNAEKKKLKRDKSDSFQTTFPGIFK